MGESLGSGLLRAAFGIALRMDAPEASLLPRDVRCPAAAEPPTHVKRVPAADIDERWAGAEPSRTRELRTPDGRVVLSVDADERRGYLLQTPADGRFLASPDGLALLCAPLPEATATWTAILVGQLLPLASTLRGLEVFHASAVAVDGGAVMFAAPVGLGKTSLALRMVLAGARLVADDAVAIEAGGTRLTAHPGAGALRVREAEHARLTAEQRRLLGGGRPAGARMSYRVAAVTEPLPLRAVFLLRKVAERSSPDGVVREAVDPFALLGSTFNLSVRAPDRLQRQLDVCARIAAEVPVRTLEIAPDADAAATAQRVLEAVT